MQITTEQALLGGLSAQAFMQRHWQKKPLLIRQAIPGVAPPVSRAALFALAERDDVESRLVVHDEGNELRPWRLRHGPFGPRSLPSPKRPGWTLLVQGLDLHVQAAHELLARFRFVPDARLDDLMLSYASHGGGVGPHFDSYDVFLLQVHGRRRWRIGRLKDPELQPGVPLKILANFRAEQEWLLEAGDMLYLPPRWAHDGVADGECMTCSIGFRAPERARFGSEVLQRMLDAAEMPAADTLYRDPQQTATATPAQIPDALREFTADALARLVGEPRATACALGEVLTDLKADVWFDAGSALRHHVGVVLDRRTRMMYDRWHVFINGESFVAAGRDATLMRRLADARSLSASNAAALSAQAWALLNQWARVGWLHADR
ncbi:MAG: cupin [Methylibium sp. NZG]|nr:MAG: cupin [Methylibium sp. NZG]